MQIESLIAIEIFKANLNNLSSDLISYLLAGNLNKFEEQLSQSCIELYNQLATIILSKAVQSDELKQKARIIGQKKGLAEIRKSEVTLHFNLKRVILLVFFPGMLLVQNRNEPPKNVVPMARDAI